MYFERVPFYDDSDRWKIHYTIPENADDYQTVFEKLNALKIDSIV